MGNILGGAGSGSQSQQSSSAPWSGQAPFLSSSFNDAQNLYNTQAGATYNNGQPTYAGPNSYQGAGINSGISTGYGMLSSGQNMAGVGSGMLNGLPAAQSIAGSYASGNANTGGLSSMMGNVPFSMNASNNGILSAMQTAQGNNLPTIGAQASAYANSPIIQQQIQSALTPIQNQLTMGTLPSLNARAVSGGNLDSSRAGAAEGLATLAAQQTGAQVASSIQNNAYNTGAQLAEGANTANMNADLGAAGQANNSMGLSMQGTNMANQTALQANGQLLSSGQLGAGLLSSGYGMQQGGSQGILSGGQNSQTLDQNQLNANLQQWQQQQQMPWNTLTNFANIIGGQRGSQGSSTSTSNPSVLQTGLQAGLLGGSLYNSGAGSAIGSGISGLGNLASGYSWGGLPSAGILGGLSSVGGMSSADALAAGLIAL